MNNIDWGTHETTIESGGENFINIILPKQPNEGNQCTYLQFRADDLLEFILRSRPQMPQILINYMYDEKTASPK